MTITVTATTVYFFDPQANSDKFYRGYQLGTWAVFQYGRRGSTGSFQKQQCASETAAVTTVADKIRLKKRGGYDNAESETFTIGQTMLVAFSGTASDCQLLDKLRRDASVGVGFTPDLTPDPAPIQHELGVLEEFNRRALAAITQAAVDPRAAMTTLAELNHDWPAIQVAVRKAESYLQTLDRMLLIGATQ